MNENQALQNDLQILKDTILSSPKNPVIAHLNLNSLKNKLFPRVLIQDILLDYLVLSETKLNKSSSTTHSTRFTFLGAK